MIVKIKKARHVHTPKRGYKIQQYYVTICNSKGRGMFTSEMYKTKQAAEKARNVLEENGLIFKDKDETVE